MKRRGFTIIEILFVTALISLLLTASYPYLGSFHASWQSVDRRSEMIQNARISMDKMVRELRQTGSFISVNQDNLIAFADVDNNPITYRLNASYLERNGIILAGPLADLTFTYYDLAGAQTAAAGDVKSVMIEITVFDTEAKVRSLSFLSSVYIRSSPKDQGGQSGGKVKGPQK